MSLKSVVSEDPSKIWVVGEEHAIHVPHFSLIPIGASIHLEKILITILNDKDVKNKIANNNEYNFLSLVLYN